MAISHELSSEIASALLTPKHRSPKELADLKNILLEVHATLQSMMESARDDRRATQEKANSATNKVGELSWE